MIQAGRATVIRFAAIWTVLAILAWPSMGLAQEQKPKSANELKIEALVAQARQHLDKSEWDQAIGIANQALAVDGASGAALVMRGRALNGKSEYDTAIKDFDVVAAKQGRDTAAVGNRADAYAARSFSLYQKGEFLKAIDSAYFAVLEKADHVEAHINRGAAYIARGQHDKAINSFNRAIQANEKHAEAYSHRGLVYGLKGNVDQALADQKKAIELNPQLAIAHYRQGLAKVAKSDGNGAMADFDQALKLKPGFVDALCDRALLHGVKRDMAKAMADLDEALKVDPKSVRAIYQKGMALLDQGNVDEATKKFDETLQLNPKHAGAFCYRGYARAGRKDAVKGNFEKAVEDFSEAIRLEPKFGQAYAGRSQAYKKLGKSSLALADSNKLKEMNAPPSKTAKKDDSKKDKDDPLAQRFVLKPKEVAPNRRVEALRSAKQVDRLIEANYTKHNVKPNPLTTDEQFVRRVYLDITGTIPTLPQTRRFLSAKEPDKRAALIDELLNGEGYASQFFNYWADVLRYTDNLNGNVRGDHFRQWIKQSLAENKPWDKMVAEMISAEGLIWENPATGYLQRDANMPLDNMNNTVRIFLGTRIGCAQCHNHPFDKWTQKEFYQMAAFTFGTLTSTGGGDKRYWNDNPNDRLQEQYAEIEQEEEDRRSNSYRFNRLIGINMMIVNDQTDRKIRLPKDYAYNDAKPDDIIEPKTLFGTPAKVNPGEPPRKAFARWLTSKDNSRFARVIANRLWKQAFGVGQIEPVDDMMDSTVAENPELMTFLESEMKRLDFDMKEYLRIVFNTETYQRQACSEEISLGAPYHFPGPMLRRMTAEQVWDAFLTLAVVKPEEYRELPARARTDVMGVNLTAISAPDLLTADNRANEIDGGQGTRQSKYMYQGTLLARASELPSPVPPNHFLRMFGQSDRELISASSTTGSVPQILFMFNGPITHMLLEKNSTIYNNVMKERTVSEGVRSVFLTILNREPDLDEIKLAAQEIKTNGPAGYGNVIWSLVNTREFLFVQ